MDKIEISLEEFHKFREFFYRKTGIQFDDNKRYFVDKRIVERIQETKSDTFRNYFTTLRFQTSGEELQKLTNLMTVNETYFFREDYQFKCLVESLLPEICAKKKKGDRVRIWSIPSSSGEEPYSIAIYLLEHWADIEKYDVELVSSDIDTDILKKARLGKYSPRSVQNLPKDILERYFEKVGAGEFQICSDLRDSVEFTRVNLADINDTRSYRNFDVVFCRNLLIYFDDLSRREAAEVFFGALNEGGYVCLGHSESMSRITSLFKVKKFPEAIVYQKPEQK